MKLSQWKLGSDTVALLLDMDTFKKTKGCLFCKSTLHTSKRCVEYNSDDDSEYLPTEEEEEDDSEKYESEEDFSLRSVEV